MELGKEKVRLANIAKELDRVQSLAKGLDDTVVREGLAKLDAFLKSIAAIGGEEDLTNLVAEQERLREKLDVVDEALNFHWKRVTTLSENVRALSTAVVSLQSTRRGG